MTQGKVPIFLPDNYVQVPTYVLQHQIVELFLISELLPYLNCFGRLLTSGARIISPLLTNHILASGNRIAKINIIHSSCAITRKE